MKLYIVTSKYLNIYLEDIIKKIECQYPLEILIYNDFNHLVELYDKYEENAIGFLISGRVAKEAISNRITKNSPPIMAFDMDVSSFYSTLVDLLLKNRNLDLDRIILDFMIPISTDITLNSLLKHFKNGLPNKKIESLCNNIKTENIFLIEDQITTEIVHLWKQKSFDLVICSYGSIIPILEENNIPYIYPIPSLETVQNIVNKISLKIEIQEVKDNLPVVISSTPKVENKNLKQSIDELKTELKNFFDNNFLDAIVEVGKKQVYSILTKKELSVILDMDYKSKLANHLNSKLNYDVFSGYGIGINLNGAFKNSSKAHKEALLHSSDFLIDENNTLIGPLDSASYSVIENSNASKISNISKKAKLSSVTIRKLLIFSNGSSVFTTTTEELSEQLNSSIRNANRILNKLVESDFAKVIYEKSSTTKGRPSKVYEINLDI